MVRDLETNVSTVENINDQGTFRIEDTHTVLTSTATDFVINAQLDAYELDEQQGNRRVHSQNWRRTIPRDLV